MPELGRLPWGRRRVALAVDTDELFPLLPWEHLNLQLMPVQRP